MKKGKKPKQFIQKPIYDGGPKAMREFIRQSLKFPKEAFQAKIEGTVRLRIRINYKGIVEHSNIIAGLGYGCDEEAKRVAELLTFKVPINRGVRAHFHKTLNFHFRLPKEKETEQTLQYTITKETKAKTEDSQANKKSYDYSINY